MNPAGSSCAPLVLATSRCIARTEGTSAPYHSEDQPGEARAQDEVDPKSAGLVDFVDEAVLIRAAITGRRSDAMRIAWVNVERAPDLLVGHSLSAR